MQLRTTTMSSGRMSTPRSQRLSDLNEARSKSRSISFSPQPPPPLQMCHAAVHSGRRRHGAPSLSSRRSASPDAAAPLLCCGSTRSDPPAAWCLEPAAPCKGAPTESMGRGTSTPGQSLSRGASPLTEENWSTDNTSLCDVEPVGDVVQGRAAHREIHTPTVQTMDVRFSTRSHADATAARTLPALPFLLAAVSAPGVHETTAGLHRAGHFMPAGAEGVGGAPMVTLSLCELITESDTQATPVLSSFNTSVAGRPSGTHSQSPPVDVRRSRLAEDERDALLAQLRTARRLQDKQTQLLDELRAFVGCADNGTTVSKPRKAAGCNVFVNKLHLMWLVLWSLPSKMAVHLLYGLAKRLMASAHALAWR